MRWNINDNGSYATVTATDPETQEVQNCGTVESAPMEDFVAWIMYEGNGSPGDTIVMPDDGKLYMFVDGEKGA